MAKIRCFNCKISLEEREHAKSVLDGLGSAEYYCSIKCFREVYEWNRKMKAFIKKEKKVLNLDQNGGLQE